MKASYTKHLLLSGMHSLFYMFVHSHRLKNTCKTEPEPGPRCIPFVVDNTLLVVHCVIVYDCACPEAVRRLMFDCKMAV